MGMNAGQGGEGERLVIWGFGALDASLAFAAGAREGAGWWLKVYPHGRTEAGGRLAPRRTALAASNASNEREICFHIGPFFW